jgi:hypothetical protein
VPRDAHTGMHARLLRTRQAQIPRQPGRPWPSVETPTVRTESKAPSRAAAVRYASVGTELGPRAGSEKATDGAVGAVTLTVRPALCL